MRRLLLLSLVVLGCSRNLSVPTVHPVVVSPAAASVAPRERLSLSASGGAGGYRFAFDGDQRPSGDDATLDAATGAYRAGSRGSAQDVVVVTDSAGSRAVARIAVGPRLVATPAAAVTSPGGALEVVASGGKPPYWFSLVDAQPATSLVQTEDAASYRAGALGDRTERVVVTDATFDASDPAAPVAACEVRIGSAVKVYANAAGQLAPYEAADFLAVGGQPPYEFDFASRDALTGLPPSGGSIDPTTGRYRAGPTGTAPGAAPGAVIADDIVARDAYHQTSPRWRVIVGPPLALSLAETALSPGRAVQLSASGGKPPYVFGFAARGNRSRGSVDAVTGTYVPGPGQGTWDVPWVTDATGLASATVARPPTVGYLEIAVGDYAGLVLPARLRGDMQPDTFVPRQDALVFHYALGGFFSQLTSVFFPAESAPVVSHGYVAGLDLPFVLDVDGDDHDDVVAFTCQPTPGKVSVLRAGVSGELTEGATLALSASHWWYLVARSPSEPSRFYTTIGCDAGGGPLTGVTAVDVGATTLATACLAHPEATALNDLTTPIAAADLDGDGEVDLAWVESVSTLRVSYRVGGSFQPSVAVSAPAGCFLPQAWFHVAEGALVPFARVPGAAKLDLAVPLSCDLRAPAIGRVDGGTFVSRTPSFSPAHAVSVAAGGLVAAYRPAAGADVIVASWSSGDRLGAARFDRAGAAVALEVAPPLPMTVAWAGFPDVDGDGTPDLVAVGSSLDAYLMRGDGDGRFGMRPRLRGVSAWAPAGDLDGDGLDDAVVATADRKLAVLLGGADQLAWGPLTALPGPVQAVTAADFLGTGAVSVTLQDRLGDYWRAELRPDLTFGPLAKIGFPGPTSPREGHHLADLGGAAPGPDEWFMIGDPASRSYVEAVVYDTTTTAHVVTSRIPDPYYGCGLVPSGVGAFRVAAACPDLAGNGITLLTADGVYAAWVPFTDWSGLSGGTQGNAEAIAVGRLGDGTAVFVVTPSGPALARHRYAITLTRGPLAARVQDLGAEADIPARRGLLADVDGDGTIDLVLMANGKGRVLLGATTPGVGTDWALGPTFLASGVPEAALRLGAQGSDVVLRVGDDLLVVPHAGGGQLQ